MLELPDIRQSTDYDCGAAATQSVFEYWGVSKPKKFYLNLLGTNGINGTDPRTLEAQIRQSGFKVLSGDMVSQDLYNQTKLERPVIVLATLHGAGHYIVVSGVYYGYVYYQDSISGPSRLRRDKFEEVWHDFDRFGQVYKQFGLSVFIK